ncbi:MAG: tripartite tricarboxylate transporter TctB family protein [Pseudooceanicola atlanticus]
MRTANLVSGVALVAFGLLMTFVVIPLQIEEGPPGMVSPRLVPQIMLWMITGLALFLVLTNLRAKPGSDPAPISRSEILALLKIAAAFAVALTLYLLVGPLWAGIALVAGTLLLLGERRPLVVVGMTVGLLAATWVLFYQILQTPIL